MTIILQKNYERVSVGYIRVLTSEDRQKLGYDIQQAGSRRLVSRNFLLKP